jgi:hypothetical protein
MSQVIDLCEGSDSDDNEEWPTTDTASVPSLLLSRKRSRDNEVESSNDTHPCDENRPGNKNATDSIKFIVDRELDYEVEVSPHRKRRGIVKNEPSLQNDAAGECAQILKGVHSTEKDVNSEV